MEIGDSQEKAELLKVVVLQLSSLASKLVLMVNFTASFLRTAFLRILRSLGVEVGVK